MITRFKFSNRIIVLLGLFAIAIWALPIWFTPGMTGTSDWDIIMHRREALRRTVVEFAQWPGHNPWTKGGVPLLGSPYLSLLSIKQLLILIFGTYWGLRFGVLIYVFICFIGSWKLSGVWWKEKFIRLVFAFYLTSNPALAYHCAVGHVPFQVFCFMPLLFYYLLRFKDDKWSGLKAAIVWAIAVNDSLSYMVQYGLLVLVCIYVYLFVSNYKANLRLLLRWTALFILIGITLTFYRIMTVLPVAFDFPRFVNFRFHFDWLDILKCYFFPYTKFGNIFYAGKQMYITLAHEVCSYVGIIAFFLFLLSFKRGLRWWHSMIVLLIWAGMGNDNYFYIMYWIQKLPGFSSHRCFPRIRVFTLLFFGIASVWGLNYLWMRYKEHSTRFFRYAVLSIGFLMAVETLVVSHLIMRTSHVKLGYRASENTSEKFKNISSLSWPEGTSRTIKRNTLLTYRAIRRNLGWLRGFGDSYLPGKTLRVGCDEPGYISEFHQKGVEVDPAYWSPNKIVLEGLDPNVPLVVNINPGNPWHSNGKQLFPEYRIVEINRSFEVMPNANGVVELIYRHPGHKEGIIGTIVMLIISCFVVMALCVQDRRRLL